jgi:hypothetical protein
MATPSPAAAAAARAEATQRNVRMLAEQAVAVQRPSFPLKLWPDDPDDPDDPPSSGWFQVIDGELHYLPLPESRAEMARSFLRAHASHPHATETPSVAQLRNLPKIVALARSLPTEQAEQEVSEALHDMLTGDSPLFTADDAPLCPLDWYTLLKGSAL